MSHSKSVSLGLVRGIDDGGRKYEEILEIVPLAAIGIVQERNENAPGPAPPTLSNNRRKKFLFRLDTEGQISWG